MQYLKTFEDYLKNNKRFSANTISSYLSDISLFLEFLKGGEKEDLSKLTLNDFREYLSFKSTHKNCKASTNARAISTLKCFFTVLKKMDILENTEVHKLRFPKLPKPLPKALKLNEIEEFIEEFEDEADWVKKRDKALFTLIYSTGLRISEALSLNKKDITKNTTFLKIKGKGEKERIIPILQLAKQEVEDYIGLCPIALLPEYPLFITEKRDIKTGKPKRLSPREAQKIMQITREKLGIASFATPHSLRHSFATHIIENGGNIRNVQGLLGHASLSTTQKYVKLEQKTLQNAYSKFHPKA